MTKLNKICSRLMIFLFSLSLVSGTVVEAASPAKQLAKGISLYNENKDEKAMDYFIDVLVNGNPDEVAQANKYIEQIHNRVGGIQTPVEVDVNFKEGEIKRLEDIPQDVIQQVQQEAQAEAEKLRQAEEQAAQQAAQEAAAKQQEALAAVEAQQQELANRLEAERAAAEAKAQAAKEAAAEQAATINEAMAVAPQQAQQELAEAAAVAEQAAEKQAVADTVAQTGLEKTAEQDFEAIADQTTAQLNAHDGMMTSVSDGSSFADLTSPEAIEARELYSAQKIASMKQAAIEKITDTKGVQLYMRDDRPDALDIEPEVIFDKNSFRTESLPLLNSIYELLALTQGSAYVILPPGSYTDDVSLSGIRQAMALNSYLINRGISQGKIHYNMGLVDEEPPARFANLQGLSIVFDYDAKLPTVLEKNEKNEKAPLLSMAIVPLCHAIDRSLGEAFAIDFSVLETVNPLDNWVLQIVQHGQDGKYYIVRQLEGFSPVYHQILFNGRKGIIGPELPCGKYTLVLTGTDLKGQKQTLRRRVIVKCADQKICDGTCSTKAAEKKQEKAEPTTLDYKAQRLWTKPGRTMYQAKATPTQTEASTSTQKVAKTVSTTTIIQIDDGSDAAAAAAPAAAEPAPVPSGSVLDDLSVNNPYDMPYEDYAD